MARCFLAVSETEQLAAMAQNDGQRVRVQMLAGIFRQRFVLAG